ncbi:MAG: hypothetical protein M1170_02285, partial [Patescibacteria group bacterium]|nr:hypothetical protein [Patescibacteria group bacterium]
MKFYSNKFLISFLILAVLFYSFSVKVVEAKGVIQFVAAVVAIVIIIYVPVLAPYILAGNVIAGIVAAKLFPCNQWTSALVGGAVGGSVGSGVAISLSGKECGNSGSSGAVGSPTLQNQTATAIMSSDGNCTTGYTLSYSVTDAYQYGIYRDGNLIKQGTLSTTVQPSPYNTSFSYTDSNLEPNKNYKYKLILTDKNGKQYRYPEINVYSECIKLDLKMDNKDGARNYFYPRNN